MKSRDILKGKKKNYDWSEVLEMMGITEESIQDWEKWAQTDNPYWVTPSTDDKTWVTTTTGNSEITLPYSNGSSGEVRIGYSTTVY
jgi:hypothetical protein